MDVEFLPTSFKNSRFWMINILERKKMQWWAQVSQFSKDRLRLMKSCFTEYISLMNFYNNINFLSRYTSKVTPNFCLLEIKYSSDPKRNSLNVFTLSLKLCPIFVSPSLYLFSTNKKFLHEHTHFTNYLLKFKYSEKATKIWKNQTFFDITK